MKTNDWAPILIPIIFVAAIAGCAMMVGSLMENKERMPSRPTDAAQVSLKP